MGTITHVKTNTVADWTQAELDAQIALGNFAPGTLLADIVLPSDWNADHALNFLGFATIAVSGQTDVVARAAEDTLNLVAGSNVTITTDPATKSVTIAAAGGGGGGVPSYLGVGDIVFAVYNVDAEVNAGDVVNGSDLFVGDPTIGPCAVYTATPAAPAFPVVVGSALAGTWRSTQYMPSSTTWGAGAVGGHFLRVT